MKISDNEECHMYAEVHVVKSDGRGDRYVGKITKEYVGGAIEVKDRNGGLCFVREREIIKRLPNDPNAFIKEG
jgi:hypothetical protein